MTTTNETRRITSAMKSEIRKQVTALCGERRFVEVGLRESTLVVDGHDGHDSVNSLLWVDDADLSDLVTLTDLKTVDVDTFCVSTKVVELDLYCYEYSNPNDGWRGRELDRNLTARIEWWETLGKIEIDVRRQGRNLLDAEEEDIADLNWAIRERVNTAREDEVRAAKIKKHQESLSDNVTAEIDVISAVVPADTAAGVVVSDKKVVCDNLSLMKGETGRADLLKIETTSLPWHGLNAPSSEDGTASEFGMTPEKRQHLIDLADDHISKIDREIEQHKSEIEQLNSEWIKAANYRSELKRSKRQQEWDAIDVDAALCRAAERDRS